MSTEATYSDVLVSVDEGLTWRRHAHVLGEPSAAIKRVREADPDLIANTDALYFATTRFTARKWEKQLVEKWGLETVDLPVDAGPSGESD